MNQDKVNQLVEKSKKYIGNTFPVGVLGQNNQLISSNYIFKGTSNIVGFGEIGSKNLFYSVNAVGESPQGLKEFFNLEILINYFESL